MVLKHYQAIKYILNNATNYHKRHVNEAVSSQFYDKYERWPTVQLFVATNSDKYYNNLMAVKYVALVSSITFGYDV